MKLSEHFHLEEFCRSETAARLGQKIVPTEAETENLRALCVDILEPVRALLGNRIMHITSGLRPRWLNNVVGGSNDSDHTLAGAADFQVMGMTPSDVCHALIRSDIKFRQLINEFHQWTHISKPRPGEEPKLQVLTAKRVGARTVYEVGVSP